MDKEKEIKRLTKQQIALEKDLAVLESRLNKDGFKKKAPAKMVALTTQEHTDKTEMLKAIGEAINSLKLM